MAIFSIFAFVWVNSAMLGRPDGRSVGRSVGRRVRASPRAPDRRSIGTARRRARDAARDARGRRARSRSIGRERDDGDGGVRDATDDRSDS
jgi:hypothetical protein